MMQRALANRASERRISAAFTAAIHIALLAALLSFRPDLAGPAEPPPPLAVDLVPAPAPEPPVAEPVPVVAISDSTAPPRRQRVDRSEAGAPAPREVWEDMDRTLGPVPAATFPPVPAVGTGLAPDGSAGMGQAGSGTGRGSGGGTGSGTGANSALDAPHWITRPTLSQMKLHDPARAATESVSGTAVLACRIDSRQRARSCRVLNETPRGYGFGSAALAAVRLGRISPAMRDGAPVYDAWVRIPVTFRNCSAAEPTCVDSLD